MRPHFPIALFLVMLGCKSGYEHKPLECVDPDSGWTWGDSGAPDSGSPGDDTGDDTPPDTGSGGDTGGTADTGG